MRLKKLVVDILITLAGIMFVLKLFLSLWPYPELAEFLQKPYSLHILDRKDFLLQVIPLKNGVRREYAPLSEIPPLLLDVFIKAEDSRFYYHNGIDFLALLRALDQNIRGGEIVSGASTITMQLARIISPHDQSYFGKLQEILQALFIEARMTKDSILELWLNSIPFGHNAVGIASASKVFFGIPPGQLSPAEIILLALIPRSPSKYTPLSSNEELVQKAMLLSRRIGFPINAIELKKALEQAQKKRKEFSWPFFAPHFVNYIQQMITPSEFARGIPLRTSLDLDLNNAVQAVLKSKIKSAEANRIHNASCLILDNYTGEILAYVGSEDYFDSMYSGQIDGIHIRNQPGSALKPYLYALALSKGFTAATVLPDIPSYFGGEEVYIPLNFNERFNGPVRLRVALASSLNIPAVYLLERLGVKSFSNTLMDIGFDSLKDQADSFGIGLALGNARVSLYELVQALALFPRGGELLPITWQKKDRKESKTYIRGRRIFDPVTAGIICHILSDKTSRVLGFSAHSILNTDFPAIFKTGTSNQFNNIWSIGATPRYTMGVWMGNFSGETVIGATDSSFPSQVVVQILSQLASKHDEFPVIENAHQVEICTLSGGKATNLCPSTMLEYFPVGVDPDPCSFHMEINGQLIVNYPPEYQLWAMESGQAFEKIASASAKGEVHIVHPGRNAVFFIDPSIAISEQAVSIEVICTDPFNSVKLFVNGTLVGQGPSPLKCSLPLIPGLHTVYAEGALGYDQISFEVR